VALVAYHRSPFGMGVRPSRCHVSRLMQRGALSPHFPKNENGFQASLPHKSCPIPFS